MFKLDVYTWPAMCGVDPKIRSSFHVRAIDAVEHLDTRQSEPYAYAVLQREAEQGRFEPCDWAGEPLGRGQSWPKRTGENGMHPAVASLEMDWDTLVAIVREQYDGTRGMMDIANELLVERHPDVYGWARDLAWAAAG